MKLLVLTTLFALVTYAAEVAGKWEIRSQSSDGQKITALLEVREDWGTWNAVLLVEDDKIPLKAVAVEGDKITFQVPTEEGTYTVKASIKGDQMDGIFTATDGTKGTLTGKRQ